MCFLRLTLGQGLLGTVLRRNRILAEQTISYNTIHFLYVRQRNLFNYSCLYDDYDLL